jgi:hypothetical protein
LNQPKKPKSKLINVKIEIIKMTYAKQDTNAIEKTQIKNQSGMIKTLP